MQKTRTLHERLHHLHQETIPIKETTRETQTQKGSSCQRRWRRIQKSWIMTFPTINSSISLASSFSSSVMQDSPKKTKSVLKSKSIIIPISILWDTFAKDITTRALIDCGSQINCIDWEFVQRNTLLKLQLPTTIRVKNVDGPIYYLVSRTIPHLPTMSAAPSHIHTTIIRLLLYYYIMLIEY